MVLLRNNARHLKVILWLQMSVFDSLLNTVWQVARSEEDFLTEFAKLSCDVERAEKILDLPQLQDFCVTDGFSGKCETRSEELRLLGDKLYLQATASASVTEDAKRILQLYTSAIKLAPHGSMCLARSYGGRSHVLFYMGFIDLALEDVKRALKSQLPQADAIKLLSLAASCHQTNGTWDKAEESLKEALDKLRNSVLENNVKATITGKIVAQLKAINESKQRDKSKVRLKVREKCLTYGPELTLFSLANFC
jgi:tetratricopeptide (TPR) repeat protein